MKVNFYATLRSIVGKKSVDMDFSPGLTARQLVEKIVFQIPELRPELLDADNNFHSHMKLFINGREVVYLENKFKHILQPEDKIDIFPPVGGG